MELTPLRYLLCSGMVLRKISKIERCKINHSDIYILLSLKQFSVSVYQPTIKDLQLLLKKCSKHYRPSAIKAILNRLQVNGYVERTRNDPPARYKLTMIGMNLLNTIAGELKKVRLDKKVL